jgi:hypothetical protein
MLVHDKTLLQSILAKDKNKKKKKGKQRQEKMMQEKP